jgi:hypothetical protein
MTNSHREGLAREGAEAASLVPPFHLNHRIVTEHQDPKLLFRRRLSVVTLMEMECDNRHN